MKYLFIIKNRGNRAVKAISIVDAADQEHAECLLIKHPDWVAGDTVVSCVPYPEHIQIEFILTKIEQQVFSDAGDQEWEVTDGTNNN